QGEGVDTQAGRGFEGPMAPRVGGLRHVAVLKAGHQQARGSGVDGQAGHFDLLMRIQGEPGIAGLKTGTIAADENTLAGRGGGEATRSLISAAWRPRLISVQPVSGSRERMPLKKVATKRRPPWGSSASARASP